jgi:hypothetical protein
MTGQTHLDAVFSLLGAAGLPYRWTLAYLTDGDSTRVFPRKISRTFWKPVLVYGRVDGWITDTVRSSENDKRFHEWGQSEAGMVGIVDRLTEPGETVCDPFMGAGTTGVAALALGRRFIGCDRDPQHVDAARRRLG